MSIRGFCIFYQQSTDQFSLGSFEWYLTNHAFDKVHIKLLQGYKVILEAPRKFGNIDVLALKNGKSIAIEIETGKSDVVWNVKQDLLSGFEKVLVIATYKKALGKVERDLAREGLIISGKVEIVLGGSSYGGGEAEDIDGEDHIFK